MHKTGPEVPEELNPSLLAIKGLPKGRYVVEADGRALGEFVADRLASASGSPPGGVHLEGSAKTGDHSRDGAEAPIRETPPGLSCPLPASADLDTLRRQPGESHVAPTQRDPYQPGGAPQGEVD
jgi:hypothetical protein